MVNKFLAFKIFRRIRTQNIRTRRVICDSSESLVLEVSRTIHRQDLFYSDYLAVPRMGEAIGLEPRGLLEAIFI